MVRPAAGIAAGLADRDHVHDLVEPAVPASESRCLTTSPLGPRSGPRPRRRRSAPCSGSVRRRQRCRRSSRQDGSTPKTSVRVVPEASTSCRMRSSRSAMRRSRARTSRTTSEASCFRVLAGSSRGLTQQLGGGIGGELLADGVGEGPAGARANGSGRGCARPPDLHVSP